MLCWHREFYHISDYDDLDDWDNWGDQGHWDDRSD